MSQTKHKVLSKGGSLTIPAEIRREHSYQGGDAVDITVDDDSRLVISPHMPRCRFCQGVEDVIKYKGLYVCQPCVTAMAKEVVTNG